MTTADEAFESALRAIMAGKTKAPGSLGRIETPAAHTSGDPVLLSVACTALHACIGAEPSACGSAGHRGQPVEYEIHAPDRVWMKRSQPHGRAILVVQSAALLVRIGQLQALLAPDPSGLIK